MIELINVSKKYLTEKGHFYALRDVSVKINKGELVGIIGSSGAGKSTLLFVIAGMIKNDEGQVKLYGKSMQDYTVEEKNNLRKTSIGFIFQQFHLIPYLTVLENIKMGCNTKEEIQAIPSFLKQFMIEDKAHQYPSQLSVGEKQRTAFIRAVVSKPEILIADEPTGNLDQNNIDNFIKYLNNFNNQGGTVLLATHNSNLSKITGRVITLKNGKVVQDNIESL